MSDLQNDLFNRHLSDIKTCHCGANKEDAVHYLLNCPLYHQIRQETIFNLPRKTTNKKKLLRGNPNYSIPFNNFIISVVHIWPTLKRWHPAACNFKKSEPSWCGKQMLQKLYPQHDKRLNFKMCFFWIKKQKRDFIINIFLKKNRQKWLPKSDMVRVGWLK